MKEKLRFRVSLLSRNKPPKYCFLLLQRPWNCTFHFIFIKYLEHVHFQGKLIVLHFRLEDPLPLTLKINVEIVPIDDSHPNDPMALVKGPAIPDHDAMKLFAYFSFTCVETIELVFNWCEELCIIESIVLYKPFCESAQFSFCQGRVYFRIWKFQVGFTNNPLEPVFNVNLLLE